MKLDMQIGDRVTYKDDENTITCRLIKSNFELEYLESNINEEKIEILKIERPKYEKIEEKKELLTEEEREFLKQYIKIIENLNNGKVIEILRTETRIRVYLKTELDYCIEVGPKFSNMKIDTSYNLSELGLEE